MAVSELQVLRFVAEAPSKVTFGSIIRYFCKTNPRNPKELKHLVAGLIQSGQLCYTSHYGNSFIELSYDQPQAVSEHVVIKPPLCSLKAFPGQCVVSLGRGAAFGGGEHPTTRLAIQLIDATLHRPNWPVRRHACRALDIGTGSGVLAIVAAKMGIGFVCGIDTDPCAVFEASDNVEVEGGAETLPPTCPGCGGTELKASASVCIDTSNGLVSELVVNPLQDLWCGVCSIDIKP